MAIDSRTTNYNYAKIVVGSDGWGLDVNANFDGIDTDIKTAYDRGLSSAEKANFTELTDGSTTTLHSHAGILAIKTFLVLANKNFWGEIFYKDTDEIVILPKASPFGSFIGAVLNDGTFLEASSAITVKYDTPANSGNILNGLGKVASSWQILIAYEDSDGDLAFGFSYMPSTTFSNASPTTTLTLAQVDSKDIGLLFSEDARFVVWEDDNEFETPIFYQDGAFSAANYDPSKSLYIDSRTATVLTLNQALEKTDFASSSTVYQVDNFKPYDYSTGALASVIGARGWNDTGIRIYINSGSNIQNFRLFDNEFWFTNGTGAADIYYTNALEAGSITTGYVNYRYTFSPPDKRPLIMARQAGANYFYFADYWNAYGEVNEAEVAAAGVLKNAKTKHGITKWKGGGGSNTGIRGYII